MLKPALLGTKRAITKQSAVSKYDTPIRQDLLCCISKAELGKYIIYRLYYWATSMTVQCRRVIRCSLYTAFHYEWYRRWNHSSLLYRYQSYLKKNVNVIACVYCCCYRFFLNLSLLEPRLN